jgi:hypothetical protein
VIVWFARHVPGQGTEKHGTTLTLSLAPSNLSHSSIAEHALQRLCRSSIVMVQPIQHRNREHLVRLVRGKSRMHWQIRNPLPKPLVGSSLIEIQDIGLEDAVELPIMEDQEMIQAFSPHASQKTFADSICEASSVRYSEHFDATRCCHACKMQSEFLIVISNQVFWRLPIRSCLP